MTSGRETLTSTEKEDPGRFQELWTERWYNTNSLLIPPLHFYRILTGFHRFTEIGQNFHKKSFLIKMNFELKYQNGFEQFFKYACNCMDCTTWKLSWSNNKFIREKIKMESNGKLSLRVRKARTMIFRNFWNWKHFLRSSCL